MNRKVLLLSSIGLFLYFSNFPAKANKFDTYEKIYPSLADRNVIGPMVIAHRGFSGSYPENTIVAFQKAIEAGADMIELDIHLSADGEVVVIHDEYLERTTSGKGRVKDYTLSQLKKFDAGSWFGKEFAGEKIPSLEEVLQLAKGKILLNIEIKSQAVNPRLLINGIEDKAIKLVEKYNMENEVVFSSFNSLALKRIKKFNPGIATALLFKNIFLVSPDRFVYPLKADAFNPGKIIFQSNLAKKAQEKGIRINVYTINNEKDMKEFIAHGVDGIFTDFPDKLIKILKKSNSK